MTQERRELAYASFEEIIADMEGIAGGSHRATGQQSFAQIVQHLTITNRMVVGKVIPPKLPFLMRMMMPFLRKGILNGPVKPGFKLPTTKMQTFFWPSSTPDLGTAISEFKDSVALYESEGALPAHPIFGKSTKEQTHNLLLKHAAMHMSFVHAE